MKFFIGSLIAFGSVFFGIGLTGLIGFFDDSIINFNNQFEVKAFTAFATTHGIDDALEFDQTVKYWLGLIFFTRHMVFLVFFFMAFICWTDAWESYDVSIYFDFFEVIVIHSVYQESRQV